MTTATQRILLVVLLVLGARARAVGQELRVTVLDSASRRPLASAVLTWFDAAGSPLGRNITNERGQQSVALSPVARRLRVLRLGYRVRDVALPPAYGPDADVLLDEGFSNGYCFRVADSEGARPNQVGLGFSAADRRKGRVDIEGALWIDTVAHVLKDIDFRFVAFRRVYGEVEPGGRVSFREMPNGMVLINPPPA